MKFLWDTGAHQNKGYTPGSNNFLWAVLPRSEIYFLMKSSDTSMWNLVFQKKKAKLTEQKWHSLVFWQGQKKLYQPHEPPQVTVFLI